MALVVWMPGTAAAHCDGLDGPVVLDALEALRSGRLEPVLSWVQPNAEEQVRGAFARAQAVRKLGPQARELAETGFLETLVRLHREGEGASYTGLKPAGRNLGPAMPAADTALKSGSAREVERLLDATVRDGLTSRFAHVRKLSSIPAEDVEGRRRYVAAYVDWVHYVEGLYRQASAASDRRTERTPASHSEASEAHEANATPKRARSGCSACP